MKKSLILLMSLAASASWAKHFYNICYYNWSNNPVSYNNDGIKHKWKERDSLKGAGEILPGKDACFKTSDETMFLTHYVTFYVNNKWYGVTNPGFSKPYAIAQGATATKGGKLSNNVDGTGHDQYNLNVHVMNESDTFLSSSKDPKDTEDIITPRLFK